jgi:hypothetical protein
MGGVATEFEPLRRVTTARRRQRSHHAGAVARKSEEYAIWLLRNASQPRS